MRTVRRIASTAQTSHPAGIAHAAHAIDGLEVLIAQTDDELEAACKVRQTGYGHHLSCDTALASFAQVEALDRAPGTVVLLCRDKATGEALGTVRIVPGHARQALAIERDVNLPHHIKAHRRAEVTRLAVLPGASSLVKLSLMKGVHAYCQAHGVDWLVIAARNEALARNYRRLGFVDLLAPGEMVPLSCAGQLPHFVFTMDVQAMRTQWHSAGHRLAGFMFEATHRGLLPSFRSAAMPMPLPSASPARMMA